MRFIDADKLIKEMLKPCPFVPDTTHYDNIYGIPIVEAIPIEWIEKKIADLLKYYPFSVLLDAYEKVLKDWEKENETNGRR